MKSFINFVAVISLLIFVAPVFGEDIETNGFVIVYHKNGQVKTFIAPVDPNGSTKVVITLKEGIELTHGTKTRLKRSSNN